MKYCSNCGKELSADGICLGCGKIANKVVINNNQAPVLDDGSIGWAFLGFFFPLIGLILFCAWQSIKPKSAKMAGKGALISVIASVVITIIIIVIAALVYSAETTVSGYPRYPY